MAISWKARGATVGGVVAVGLIFGAGAASAAGPPGHLYMTGGSGGHTSKGGGVVTTPVGDGNSGNAGTSGSLGEADAGGGAQAIAVVSTTSNGGSGTVATSAAAVSDTGLPFTGFDTGGAVAIGLGALGAGTAFVAVSRRRRGGPAAA